jgi:hypothetical protein
MILKQLQDLIGGIYDVSISHDVYDFLVTDRDHLPVAARTNGPTDEELIVAQPEEGGSGEIAMSLYLDPELLERLDRADPMERLLAWNAGHDKPVSLLELEMQAEVDKYVGSYWLMRRQFPDRFPAELLRLLFERTRIDSRLAAGREDLYREASRHAQKFCTRLEQSLRGAQGRSQVEVLAELRRFYRLTNARKLAHIQRTG